MKNKIIISFLAIFLLFFIASSIEAISLEELQTKINQSQAQINQLLKQSEEQLVTEKPVTSTHCITSDLFLGMTNNEVKILQEGLKQDTDIYPEGLVTGYFGPLTKAAVIRFQEKYASDILNPWGFNKGTGYAGTTTKAKFNTLYCQTTTTTDLPPCQWCGSACIRLYSWMVCPDVAPPAGFYCVEINGQCDIAHTPQITLQTTTTTISPTTDTTIPPMTVNIVASPISINYNDSIFLNWRSNNARYCFASASPSNTQWSGTIDLSGTKNIHNIAQDTTFLITCLNIYDSRVTKQTNVYIKSTYVCDTSTWQCHKPASGSSSLHDYPSLSACQAECQPPTETTTTTTTTTVPIKYTCNPSTWQCVLTYGGGQYDTLAMCEARCQPPTETTTTTTTTTVPIKYTCNPSTWQCVLSIPLDGLS